MKLRIVFAVAAVVGVFYGVTSLLVPTTLVSFFGVTLNEGGVLASRYAGAAFLGLGLASWWAREAAHSEGRLALVRGLAVQTVLGTVVSLVAVLAGTTNALGWVNVIVTAYLVVGFGYYGFVKPGASTMGEAAATA